MKRAAFVLAVVLVLLGVVYVWGFVVPESADGQWPLDIAELRTLAHSVEGDLPTEVRVENVATFEFPSGIQVQGSGWSGRPMTCFAYQLVYPSRTAVVDTAMDEKTARGSVPVKAYDAAAFERVQKALAAADFVVVTHEHFDHIGGVLVSAPGWEKLVANQEQLEHPELIKPLAYPAAKPKTVLEYKGAKAVAPGVVVVRAPGHTPGSQLVYVQRADGLELLFLGDVAWQHDNVEQVRSRARLVTKVMGENSHDVLQQLAALHALHEHEPKVLLVPGHDGAAVDALIAQGALVKGFSVAP